MHLLPLFSKSVLHPCHDQRFYQLDPDEEALVEAVLSRGEEEEVNPFDVSFAIVEADDAEGPTNGQGGSGGAAVGDGGEEGGGESRPATASSSSGRPWSPFNPAPVSAPGAGAGISGAGGTQKPLSLAVINAKLEK